jgi:uncharacterized protein (DUF1330 family)
MPKAYWIAQVTVSDPQTYALYAAGATKAFAAHGARILARGGTTAKLEGEARNRNVVIEFDSLQQAVACYQSADYQAAARHRETAGEATIFIVEGV